MAEKAKEENKDEEEKSQYEQLTSTQKCAILMMLLGEEEASEILKNLGPKEVQQLGKEMYNVQGLDQETVNRVLDEFLAIIKDAVTFAFDKTSPPTFFSQIISCVSESIAITNPFTSETINFPKPAAIPEDN